MDEFSLFNYVDLTYLGDDEAVALSFLDKATTANIAAICISPQFVTLAKQGTSHRIASVVNFPGGDDTKEKVLQDIDALVADKVDEIDIVFPYKTFLQGDKTAALKRFETYIHAIPPNLTLKVIIETGELKSQAIIQALCHALIDFPIHFIKTSTGKTPVGATQESAETILSCIQSTDIGLKVSGGIRTLAQAEDYLRLAESYLKERPLTANRFRIGASQLRAV